MGIMKSWSTSSDPSRIDLLPIQFNRDLAPMIKRRRMSDCPDLEMRPSRSLPPDDNRLGTSPSHAAKSRPHLKVSIAGAKASIASAVIGPTPGTVCSLRAMGTRAVSAAILRRMTGALAAHRCSRMRRSSFV